MRAIALIVVVAAGCGSDISVADGGADLGGADLAVCMQGVGAPPTMATPCGPLTCAPGQICVAHQPGTLPADMAQLTDGGVDDGGAGGGDPYFHSCVVLPPECQRCGGCGDGTLGAGGKQFGCFASICVANAGFYETGCRFDGATLTCIGL